jgi:iron complex outermembrane recepter protein
MRSDQFGRLFGPIRTFEFAPAQGGSETAPYLRAFRTTDDARETLRQSFAGSADWRPIPSLTLSVSARHIIYDLFTAPQRITFNTGNNPVSAGPDHTYGRTGAGSIVHQQIWTTKFGDTDQFTLSGRYREGLWRGDFSASYANSGNKYRDLDRGFFRGATTRMVSPTIRWEGFSRTDMPRVVDVRNSAGQPVDWTRLENYQLVNVLSVQRDATDEITSGSVNLRRELSIGSHHGAIQIGGAYRKREVDRGATDVTRSYVGPDRVALSADDGAGPYVDSRYLGVDQKFGVPRRIEWPDLRALYRLYQERPEYFTQTAAQATSSYIFEAGNSERIAEEITAAYVQGEATLWRGRLRLLGGVRFERTENTGVGLLRDRNAVYQRDAAGNLLRAPNGNPILITTDTLARARLEYRPRALVASRSYSDYYPSINATYRVAPDLLLRVSYARTLGRPNFNNVVPNLDVIEDVQGDGTTGLIVGRNPALQPWEGDNYEASIEYYFSSGGVASVGVFRKDVSNGFGTQTVVLDDGLLRQFELDPPYLGWDLRTTFNIGELVRITGVELSYRQKLGFLPAWARGLSAFANTTILDIDGPTSAFSTLYDRTANWGLSYSRGRVGLGLNWNYVSSRTNPLTLGGAAGQRYDRSRLTLDLTSEFRFTPRLSLFFNARNLTNTLDKQERFLPRAPDFSRAYAYTERGVKMSAGVRGTF